jgi:hypothetical protein
MARDKRRGILTSAAGSLGARAADKAHRKFRELTHPHRCGSCNRDFRGYRAMNAHHLAVHAQRWTSKKARAAARAMGKDVDRMRRHAAGWLEASGLRDPRGKTTDRARSRPQAPGGRLKVRSLRQMHRHDRHHERAAGHDARAARSRNPLRRARLQNRAAGLRGRWPGRPAPAARAASTRPAPAASRPAPARPAPASRPAPSGRLAPSRAARSTR